MCYFAAENVKKHDTEQQNILALALLGIQKIVSPMVMPLCNAELT